jgi:hypothetical protein
MPVSSVQDRQPAMDGYPLFSPCAHWHTSLRPIASTPSHPLARLLPNHDITIVNPAERRIPLLAEQTATLITATHRHRHHPSFLVTS